ncbi:MGMT family protein [Candidatus Shapirobacteria bacterium]|nr:MGMT family protein [Candidatus Shapirobacteria bacterium]
MKLAPGEFSKKVCALALTIPPGRVTTYGLLTVAAGGHPILSQMITTILSRSPDVDKIPFHRIVYSGGKVWLDDKHRKTRLALYKKEGIKLTAKDRVVDFEKIIYTFP